MSIPARLQGIIDDFQMCQGREKLEYLLEFSERLAPLPEWLREQRDSMDQVHECMTPVFVFAEEKEGRIQYHFDVPPESPTVRGYAALLAEGLNGLTPPEITAVPSEFYLEMGLHKVLTGQRLHGVSAILAHMKRLAKQ
jgi:cysteine desulfuration protein SufE